MSQRFTDAELAAEYWKAALHATVAAEDTYPWYDEESENWPAYKAAQAREETLNRFATLPHAHKENQ